MEIVKLDPKEYGLEESKAKEIAALFTPMLDKMVELEGEYNNVVALKITEETCARARELRLQYVKVRTGTDEIHKKIKAFYLAGGRFVDGWRNSQRMAAEGNEAKLKAIETHFENIEKERITKLQATREGKLQKLGAEVIPDNLGELDESVWASYYEGMKFNAERKKEAEKKAELERLAEEKKAKEAAIAKEKELKKLREENEKILAERKAKEEALAKEEAKRKEQAKKEEVERAAAAAKIAKEHEAKLKAELAAREKAEKELADRKAEDARKLKEADDKRQAELNADDHTKVKSLITNLENMAAMYTFKSEKNKKMYSNVGVLIGKIVKYIQE